MAKVDKKWWIIANKTKIKQKLTKFDEYCKENNIHLATKETLLIFCNLEEDEYESLKNNNIIAYDILKMKIRVLENNIKLYLLNNTKGGVSVYAQYYGRENETEINYAQISVNIEKGRDI